MAVHVRLLGGFTVTVEQVPVAPVSWARRHAAGLVKLLALARDRRLHREQVMEALWPGIPPDAAAPRLHKAAHYARKALGDDPSALVLRNDLVVLLPDVDVTVDVEQFHRLGAQALTSGSTEEAAAALGAYGGPLLPEDVYEEWTDEPRRAARELHLDLLRLAGRWEELLAEEPADEQAHLALARSASDSGDTRRALRQLERMEQALQSELGTALPVEAVTMRAQLQRRGPAPVRQEHPEPSSTTRLVGRRDAGDRVREALERATAGRGSTLVFAGAPGVGKTAVLDLAVALAHQRDWRVGRGSAAAVEGPWPYSPVLEVLGDLCRRHPALLDGLDDAYREEIEKALSGRDVSWSGEFGHQRLFVATAELVRLAATGHGLLLVVDDVHHADEASLRLLHYLSRCVMTEPVVIALAHRDPAPMHLRAMTDSLVGRGTGALVVLEPLSLSATERLLADRFPELSRENVEEIWSVGAGLPFTMLELARGQGSASALPVLSRPVMRTFQRLALLGRMFSTDELLAASGVDEDEAYEHLELGLASKLVEPCRTGYCFRHGMVRDGLVAEMPAHTRSSARHLLAEKLAELGEPPARVAHQYLAAGMPSRAVPYVVRAVENAGAVGAYRDALAMIDGVRDHAGPEHLPRLLARRGDLLMAVGDPGAVTAYREAAAVTTGTEQRLVRARLSRAASLSGDLETARGALAGLEVEGDAADAPLLLARGNLAYFSGDLETAWDVANQARDRLQAPDDPWHLMDLVGLQGLIAHQRGEWFERFRVELRRTQGHHELATALFDAHLCVAEYLLYGPEPYAEVIADADELRRRAAQAGALRGVAFATTLLGEAALLSGDLDRAERELLEAVALHRDIDAVAGEAHSLQRLAELRLVQGDREEALRLLDEALPKARWSVVSRHLLQRIYATMIAAAPDRLAARAVVDRAEATTGQEDFCLFCAVMLAVPAAVACADVGDTEAAERHLAVAERSVAHWQGSSWEAALLEARAHLARAEGDHDGFVALSLQASQGFDAVGHHRDAERCRLDAAVVPAG